MVMQKHNKYKKQYEKDQQTFETSVKIYKKILQKNLTDENEPKCLWKTFTRCVDETKNEFF